MYISDAPVLSATQLVPLEPDSLLDLTERPPLAPGARTWLLSADGSTLVSFESAAAPQQPPPASQEPPTVVVRDLAAGAERARFTAPAAVAGGQLSRDGSRLLAQRLAGGVPQPDWFLLDTATGQVLGTVHGDAAGPWL